MLGGTPNQNRAMSNRSLEMIHRDLKAFCDSPNLLETSSDRLMTNPCKGFDATVDCDLKNFPENRQRKLGLYAENLLIQWLSLSPEHSLLAHDLVIQGENRTLGALDFIVDTPAGVEHWELALKFYLGVGGRDWDHWVGPSIKDSLAIKMARVDGHQLQLSTQPVALQHLNNKGIPRPVHVKFMLKGMFFSRWGKDERPTQCPEGLKLGLWIPQNQAIELGVFPGMWGIVERYNWISGHTVAQYSPKELSQISIERPIMIAQNFAFSDQHDHRVFLVPDSWEKQAQTKFYRCQ